MLPPTAKRQRFIDSNTFKESEKVKQKYENALHTSNCGSSTEDVHIFKQFLPVIKAIKNHFTCYTIEVGAVYLEMLLQQP